MPDERPLDLGEADRLVQSEGARGILGIDAERGDLHPPIPEEVQLISSYSAGVAVSAREPERARALIAYLASPTAMPAILKTGMEEPGPGARRMPR